MVLKSASIKTSNFVLLQNCFCSSGILAASKELRGSASPSLQKNSHWNFDRDSIESTDHFVKYCHFNSIRSSMRCLFIYWGFFFQHVCSFQGINLSPPRLCWFLGILFFWILLEMQFFKFPFWIVHCRCTEIQLVFVWFYTLQLWIHLFALLALL